jgi:hypothetical protein
MVASYQCHHSAQGARAGSKERLKSTNIPIAVGRARFGAERFSAEHPKNSYSPATVINLRTAKPINYTVPTGLVLRAE